MRSRAATLELEAVLGTQDPVLLASEDHPRSASVGRESVVVAGTHGKTTTTSLTAWLLTHGSSIPRSLVGGIALNFGAAARAIGSARPQFVIEGTSTTARSSTRRPKFSEVRSRRAVINNIEFDHADIYANLDEVRHGVPPARNLVPRTGLLLLGADSPDAAAIEPRAVSPVETFGLG
jgi:UDP-N-acetylmuramate: L-alanyl-gamma-D-glutamyl-meso-diaminopimelate ligase